MNYFSVSVNIGLPNSIAHDGPLPAAKLQKEYIRKVRYRINTELAERGWCRFSVGSLSEESLRILVKEYTQAGYVVQEQTWISCSTEQEFYVILRQPNRPAKYSRQARHYARRDRQ